MRRYRAITIKPTRGNPTRKRRRLAWRHRRSSRRRRLPEKSPNRKRQRLQQKRKRPSRLRQGSRKSSPTTHQIPRLSTRRSQSRRPNRSKNKGSKTPPAQGKLTTARQQLAALSPAPNYSIGAAAKAVPISGGTEKASYES